MESITRQFFTNEFKEEAVKLVVDGGLTVAEAARRLSISSQTLKNWVTKHRAVGLAGHGCKSVSESIQTPQRTCRNADRERTPKKGYGVPCKGAAAWYAMIGELRSRYSYKLGVMCQALELSRSGYYAWKCRKPLVHKLEVNG